MKLIGHTMATSNKSNDEFGSEPASKKKPNRRRAPATNQKTRSKASAMEKGRIYEEGNHGDDVVLSSQLTTQSSVSSSQIHTKYVPLIECEDSMKDFQSPDVVFVGVSSKSRRQTTISDLFGTGGQRHKPSSPVGKTNASKLPSKTKTFKSPKKKPPSRKVASEKVEKISTKENSPRNEKILPDSSKVSVNDPRSSHAADGISIQSCPFCQMPFTLLMGRSETAESHTTVCMDNPFGDEKECDLGAACQSRSPGHYRDFRHSARARLLSGAWSEEGENEDVSEFADSGISSAGSTPLDCLKAPNPGKRRLSSSSSNAGKSQDLELHAPKKIKASSAASLPSHLKKDFSPIPEEEVANSSFIHGNDSGVDNVIQVGDESPVEETDDIESGQENEPAGDSACVASLATPCKESTALLEKCEGRVESLPPNADSDGCQGSNSRMDVSLSSDDEGASENEVYDTAQDNLKDFTSSSSSGSDDDDANDENDGYEKEEEVVHNMDEDDDDDILAVMPLTADPPSKSSCVSTHTSPSKEPDSAPATQQLSIFNFFQPVNQKSASMKVERFASGQGLSVRGRKKGSISTKLQAGKNAAGKTHTADSQPCLEAEGTLRKSTSDVSTGSKATTAGGGWELRKSMSEILPGRPGQGGRPGRGGSTGGSWQTATEAKSGSGWGRTGWGGRGRGDVWTRGGGDQACPFYKKIPDTGFTVDAFRYGPIPGCTAYFLTHFHYDHFGGLTRNFTHSLYCSKVTGNLVKKRIGVGEQHITCLPLDSPCVVDGVEVTLIEANHCPGAVLLLFRLPSGRTVLHTGDFRADPSMENHPALANTHIHSLYLDTTYCDPSYAFPPQSEVVSFAVSLVRKAVEENPQVLVVCGAYTIGKERIFTAIAEMLDCKVGVLPDKRAVLQCLEDPGLMGRVTTRLEEARVHVLPMGKLQGQQLEEHLSRFKEFSGVLALEPTGWTFNKKALSLEHIKPKYSRHGVVVYGVPYSEHSSFLELKRFVQFTRPDKILPTVNNGSAASRRKMDAFFRQWLSEGTTSRTQSPSKQTSLSAWRR